MWDLTGVDTVADAIVTDCVRVSKLVVVSGPTIGVSECLAWTRLLIEVGELR